MQVEMGIRNLAQLAGVMRHATLGALLLLFVGSGASYAQNPNPAANGTTGHNNEGFYPGWNLSLIHI